MRESRKTLVSALIDSYDNQMEYQVKEKNSDRPSAVAIISRYNDAMVEFEKLVLELDVLLESHKTEIYRLWENK